MFFDTSRLTVAAAAVLLASKAVSATPAGKGLDKRADFKGDPYFTPGVTCDDKSTQTKVERLFEQYPFKYMACGGCHFEVGHMYLSTGTGVPETDSGDVDKVEADGKQLATTQDPASKEKWDVFDIPEGAKKLTLHWKLKGGDYPLDADIVSCS